MPDLIFFFEQDFYCLFIFRISLENGHFCQDYNDDKEAKAGSVLLNLLQVPEILLFFVK